MDLVEVVVNDRVATVTFSRPPVNALNRQALLEIAVAFESLADRRVSVAVFRTGGERAFIAGADLKEFEEEREAGPAETVDRGAGADGWDLRPGRSIRAVVSAWRGPRLRPRSRTVPRSGSRRAA